MKKVLSVIAVLFLLSTAAFASQTELAGMGGIPAQLTDTDQVLNYYPSQILNFKNEIVLEYINPAGGSLWGNTIINMGSSAIGFAMLQNPGFASNLTTLTGLPALAVTITDAGVAGVPSLAGPAYVFGIVYGLDLGGTTLGINLFYGSDSTDDETKDIAGAAAKGSTGAGDDYLKIVLGASLNVGMPMDVALSLAMPGYSSNPKTYNAAQKLTSKSFEDLSAMNLDLAARTKMDTWLFDLDIAYVSEDADSLEWLDPLATGNPTTNTEWTSTANTVDISLLSGNKMKATDTIGMTLGGGLQFATTDSSKDIQDNKITGVKTYGINANSGLNIYLPVYFTADCKVNETWNFTAGVSKDLLSMINTTVETVNPADGKTVANKADDTTFTLDSPLFAGMCLKGQFGDIQLQWLLSATLLRAGPYFISGAANNLGSQIALVYNWK